MKTFTYTVKDRNGIHARPAGLLVQEAKKFASTTTISLGNKNGDMKKLFALMGLNIRQGDNVTVTVDGADESAAFTALEAFFKANL